MGLGFAASAQSTLNGTFNVTESWQITIKQQYDPPVTYTGSTNGTVTINNGQYSLIDATGISGGDPFNITAHNIAGGPPYTSVGELPYAGTAITTNGLQAVFHLGFFSVAIPRSTEMNGTSSGSPFSLTGQTLTGLAGTGNENIQNYYTITATSTSSLQEQAPPPPPAPFFTGQIALSSPGWYWLGPQGSDTYGLGYFSEQYFPYIFHNDLGWEYFIDAADGNHGAYFYDFADNAWWYSQPALFPYMYDFNQNVWMFCAPQTGKTDQYQSGPRWFLNTSTKQWVNNL